GYDVIAIFMRNWHDESVIINNECPWIDDSNDAMLAAAHLGIPFHVLDMSGQYRERIVDYMFREYEAGRTPNPDVLCNREIKFDLFLQAALNLKADYVATGHYCRKGEITAADGKVTYQLLAGVDENKDQSYFLCQLSQQQLSKALFPIGHLKKPEVRKIAEEIGLPNAAKKDSQGLCFIGKVKLPVFLQQQLEVKKGKIYEMPDNTALYPDRELHSMSTEDLMAYCSPYQFSDEQGVFAGEHNGAHFYTIGQRKGLGVGGRALPMFILGTSVKENNIYVGQGENHRALIRRGLFIRKEEVHWVRPDLMLTPGQEASYQLRIRYRQPLFEGRLICREEGIFMLFNELQRGLASGQFAAWYLGEELIGSGVIS
ncbi:MAG: tRNA 2-thiouridine(34) synthase MnmA, partial [Flavobacteriales bacterium]|nr:tRNA 2-thiouridine(34) synthase MnmA [Flavobacteriales bacterium]